MAWLAAAVFTLSCKYFYEAIMAEDDDEDHGKRERVVLIIIKPECGRASGVRL